MLVLADVGEAQPIDVVECRTQADGVGNVWRSGFKRCGRRIVRRFLKRHVLDHVPATLLGGHDLLQFFLGEDGTDPVQEAPRCLII